MCRYQERRLPRSLIEALTERLDALQIRYDSLLVSQGSDPSKLQQPAAENTLGDLAPGSPLLAPIAEASASAGWRTVKHRKFADSLRLPTNAPWSPAVTAVVSDEIRDKL